MNKLDYKKEYKDLYLPKTTPTQIDVPNMKFICVTGKGDPNQEAGEYQQALQLLYGLSFTIKMSKMGDYKIDGYFEYVVPPLEGFWWMEREENVNYVRKEDFNWISMIRQPDFVTREVFQWACEELKSKKGLDTKNLEFREIEEGLCVQILHVGSYDDEPKTIQKIEAYMEQNSLKSAIGDFEKGFVRRHHEIYLSDPRRTKVENLKTVIRIPVKKER